MKRKLILCISLLLVASISSRAVFNESSINKTLQLLKQELRDALDERMDDRWIDSEEYKTLQEQSKRMSKMAEDCNKLALVLYSQGRDFTFEITYALDMVREEYNSFQDEAKPHLEALEKTEIETERYRRLTAALAGIPPTGTVGEAAGDSLLVSEEIKDVLKSFIATFDDAPVFLLEDEGLADRDTCMTLASAILESYESQLDFISRDNRYYNNLKASLDSAYTYAETRYEDIHKQIYKTGQASYFTVLGNFSSYLNASKTAISSRLKRSRSQAENSMASEWSSRALFTILLWVLVFLIVISTLTLLAFLLLGRRVKFMQSEEFRKARPYIVSLVSLVLLAIVWFVGRNGLMGNYAVIAATMVQVYLWLAISVLLTVVIGYENKNENLSMRAFRPILVLAAIVALFRMAFISDSLLNLTWFPIMLAFAIWQCAVCVKVVKKLEPGRAWLHKASLVAIIVGMFVALFGYVLLSLQLMLLWTLLLSCLFTLYAMKSIAELYYDKKLCPKKDAYTATHRMAADVQKGDFIRVTWFYDFFIKAFLPVALIISVYFCVWYSADLFNQGEACKAILLKPILDLKSQSGLTVLHISIYLLMLASCLFFIFRYVGYVAKSLYRVVTYEKVMEREDRDVILPNEVNLTLANNVINILTWGLYIIVFIILFKIPLGTISAVFAGLAAGIGVALKDVLNNFMCGMQLMSGRLRVGDWVQYEDINGHVIYGCVDKISYQSTEIQTFEGPVVAITNSALLSQSFKNISKSTPYQYLKTSVSVGFSEDYDKIRNLVSAALQPELEEKDEFDRPVVEQSRGINIAFGEISGGNITIEVRLYVRAESLQRVTHSVNETIYRTLKENGITPA